MKVSCYVGKFDYNFFVFFAKGFPLNNQMGSCISSQSRAEKQFSKGWSAVPTRKVINCNLFLIFFCGKINCHQRD